MEHFDLSHITSTDIFGNVLIAQASIGLIHSPEFAGWDFDSSL
jgi:hypothetical protein